jgi:putative ABC transport system ATP-binding protein
MTAIELRGVVVRYRAGDDEARVGPVDLRCRGGLVALSGPSGSGKSSLLRLVALEAEPSEGLVLFDGRTVSVRSRRGAALRRGTLAVVHDRANRDLFDELTCREQVLLWSRLAPSACDELLDDLELGAVADRRPGALSGGETRRAALAVALARRCPVVVVDEPTAGLHERVAARVTAMLRAVADAPGGLVVASTHDPAVVAAADVVLGLEHGRVTGTSRDRSAR